ncbi:MAG: hypothetical protein M0Z94_05285, partial [Dehalococcoidales bacterium]|nr:hypothetical protein [Dehalococcoidales bacterium]
DPTLSVGANGVRPPATHWLDSRFRGNDGTGRPCSKHNAGLFSLRFGSHREVDVLLSPWQAEGFLTR